MIARRSALLVIGLAVAAGPLFAQTPAQLLEKAIFSEDTAGDVDGAVTLYRRVLAAHDVPRDVAARADERLAASLRRTRAAEEARQSRQPGPPPPPPPAPPRPDSSGCCGTFSENYDPGRPVTVTGQISAIMWVNPQSVLTILGSDGNLWGFTLPAPNVLIRGGLNRDSLRLGTRVHVSGFLSRSTGERCPTQLPNGCETLPASASGPQPGGREPLHASASTVIAENGAVLFDRVTVEQRAQATQR